MLTLQKEHLKWLESFFKYVVIGVFAHSLLVSNAVKAESILGDWPDSDSGSEWFSDLSDEGQEEEESLEEGLRENLTINGYLKNEVAYRYDEPRSITKIRNILYLNGDYLIDDNRKLVFSAWAYHDLAYDLFDYETIAARFVRDSDKPLVFLDNLEQKKDSPVAEFRELYLDMYGENLDFRIGKQFVVWGVFDGVRVTDEINPQDFRELILPDLLDYRIPLWTVKADYYSDSGNWQVLWIPDIKFHRPAPPGSEWELLQEVANTTFPDSFEFKNSELGFRYSSELYDTQFSLSYFYTWDDFPVIFRTVKIDSSVEPFFYPTYTRINMYGATFVRPVGDTIVKGEMVYVPDKYFGLTRETDRNNDGFLDSEGELQLKHFRWALGVDFNKWSIDFSPAISQWIILDYDSQLIQDEYDTSITLFARKPLPENSAVMQVLFIWLVNMEELYIKPKYSFDVTDRFKVAFGMDLFYGAQSKLGVSASGGAVANLNAVEQSAQFFGNFHNNDRVFVEFKYTF